MFTLKKIPAAALFACLCVAGSALPQQATSNQNAAMREMMQRMMPGDGHKIFSKMAGKWTHKMKVWNSTAPNAPPMESTGESESKLVLGGRFLLEETTGSVMRMPMQRMSILGYDNFTKTYTLIFYSSMETATNIATGTMDAEGKILTLRGEFTEPQGKYGFKNVVRMESNDIHVFESYRIMPDGTEMKIIEQVSTRVKQQALENPTTLPLSLALSHRGRGDKARAGD